MRDKRISKLPPSHFRREESSIPSDPGPFVAKVKNNLDPTRSGRLQVWIPDLGAGQEEKVELQNQCVSAIYNLEQRYDDRIGAYKFKDGTARLDITGHVVSGWMNMI